MRNSLWKWLLPLVVGVILVAVPFALPIYLVTLVNQMFIYGILAMSLNLLLGYTGLPSFGHAGFFGTATYVVAILSTRYGVGFGGCVVSSFLITTGITAVFGLLVAHTTGVYYLMITFALGMVLWGLALRWGAMTGGDNGIAYIPQPDIGVANLSDPTSLYFFTLVIFAVIVLALYIIVRSPFGHTLLGIRESESRMRTLGYNTWLHKYIAFVLAGAFASFAGILWAYYQAFICPAALDLGANFEAFLMVILGGPGTLFGPAIGAGVIVFLKNFISAYTQRWLIFLGIIYIIIVLYAPQGLVNLVIDYLKKGKEKEDLAASSTN